MRENAGAVDLSEAVFLLRSDCERSGECEGEQVQVCKVEKKRNAK